MFPDVLLRTCAEAFDLLESLQEPGPQRVLDEMRSARVDLARHKTALVEQLYELARIESDDKRRTFVIDLKRDVFNERPVSSGRVTKLGQTAPDSVLRCVEEYRRSLREIAALDLRGERRWQVESMELRRRFATILQRESLRRGLVLSSRAMHRALDAYLESPPRAFSKAERDIEKSLLKYLSRICTKTSPFSTFTNVTLGRVMPSDHEGRVCRIRGDHRVHSTVRLNHFLYADLRDVLVMVPSVRKRLRLSLNPSLRRDDVGYSWVLEHAASGAFQSAALDPVLDLLHSRMCGRDEPVVWESLLEALLERVDASREKLDESIRDLVSYGFLEVRFSAPGNDPEWPRLLREELRPSIAEPAVASTVRTLEELTRLAARFGPADAHERDQILGRGDRLVDAMLRNLRRAVPQPPPDPRLPGPARKPAVHYRCAPEDLFFEDTTTDFVLELDEPRMTALASSLADLAAGTAPFEVGEEERRRMYDYYKSKYKGRPEVEALRFYEDYSRDASHAGRQRGDVSRNKRRWLEAFERVVRAEAAKSRETLDFDRDDLRRIDADGITPRPARPSYAVMLQLFADTEESTADRLLAVLNGLGTGYGKALGRFLHLFDPRVTEDLRAWNAAASGGALFLEACDGSFFSANVHPPLMPYEVKTPNSHNLLPRDRRISVAELVIRADDGAGRLQLRHRETGKGAYVFDLGFESLSDRSTLYRFLHGFSVVDHIQLQPLFHVIGEVWNEGLDTCPETADRTLAFPRVTWDGGIVLQRRASFVPCARLPHRQRRESGWSYFRRVNDWRLDLGLPADVFVTLDPQRGRRDYSPGARGRDAHKPQYVSFRSPLFSDLFASIVRRTTRMLKVEEMLPAPDQLFVCGGGRYVCEVVFQWYAA